MITNNNNEQIIISNGILQKNDFGCYLVMEDNLSSVEYYLFSGCETLDEAKTKVAEIIENHPSFPQLELDVETIEFRKRKPIELDNTMRLISEEDLKSSVASSYIGEYNPEFSLATFLKDFFSYRRTISLLPWFALWLFWTNGSITIPKDIGLPFVGDRFGGTVINASILALYFPIVLLFLYIVVFIKLIKTNLQYDYVRRQILALVLLHEWRILDFIQLIQTQLTKSKLGWFINLVDGLVEKDPATLAGLLKQATTHIDESGVIKTRMPDIDMDNSNEISDNVEIELKQMIAKWLPSEFERRIHNLYYLDKENDYSKFFACFDPLSYIISHNRVQFRTYQFLREKGVKVDTINAPRDPYIMERVFVPSFWFGQILGLVSIGTPLIWSFFVVGYQLNVLFIVNIISAILVLLFPMWWNYQTLIKRRCFPKSEPLGAYAIGSMGLVNSFSVL